MDSERARRIDEVLNEALKREPQKRAAFLDEACGNDQAMRQVVETLLALQDQRDLELSDDPEAVTDPGGVMALDGPVPVDDIATLPEGAFPGYEIVRELSHGGQGVVYQAIQESTKRKVAIKVLLDGPYASNPAKRRFEREIELVASLKHPNVISVFHSGQTIDGRQFYVMDYVRGVPLNQYARDHELTLEDILELFTIVCEAVNYAHQKGVIHRDLKPSNILVDADGTPKVLDFGLAKQLGGPEQTLVSLTGQVVGTLPYMSPEQARGNPDEIDIRTDVYALGVVLYELLTGHYPYPVVGQMAQVLRHISETEPRPPTRSWESDSGVAQRSRRRKLRVGACPIDDEVQTIVLKLLSKERRRRYQSAGELALDITRYLAGGPIEAKRDSVGYLLLKAVERHRMRLAVAAAILLMVCVTAYSTWSSVRQRTLAHQVDQRNYLLEAQSNIFERNWVKAIESIKLVLDEDPSHLEACLLRVQVLRETGRADAAYTELRALAQDHPDQGAIYHALAEMTAQSNSPESRDYVQRARELVAPGSADGYYLRSLGTIDNEKAIELLDRALEEDPLYFEARMARAVRHYRRREFDSMRLDAEVARSVRPDDAKVWHYLGRSLEKLNKMAQAQGAFRTAVRLDPDHFSAHQYLGLCSERLGDIEGALRAYKRCLELDPKSAPSMLFNIGRACSARGNESEALGHYRKAESAAREQDDPRALRAVLNSTAWVLLTHEDLECRDYAKALNLGKEALSLSPEADPNVLGTLALAELRAGEFLSARDHALEALKLRPNLRWSTLVVARAELELGNFKEAAKFKAELDSMIGEGKNPDVRLSRFVAEYDRRVAGQDG